MDAEQRDLLLSLAFVYLAAGGRERRALPLLLLVAAAFPADEDALRALAHAYTAIGQAERALVVLDRLAALGREGDNAVLLLRSRALHRLARIDEARSCFAAIRRDAPATLIEVDAA